MEWVVVYDDKEVVASFNHYHTAVQFISSNRKIYFSKLKIYKINIWEQMLEDKKNAIS